MLEVIAASALIATMLVPALAMMRDAMAMSRDIDQQNLLSIYAVSKIEEQMGTIAASWTTGAVAGDYAADGHSDIRFTATRSDAVVDGGLVDQLMNIDVTTYYDANSNDTLDAGEFSVDMSTKVGKFVVYESEAGS